MAVVVDVGSVEVEAGTADVVELQENTLACVLQLTTTFPVAYAEAKKFNRASCRTFWFTHKAGFSFKPLKLQKTTQHYLAVDVEEEAVEVDAVDAVEVDAVEVGVVEVDAVEVVGLQRKHSL